MRRTHTTSRRGGLTTASAALVCLGALTLTACGSGQDQGYVATGAERSERARPPKDGVSLVPLPGSGKPKRSSGTPDAGGAGAGSGEKKPDRRAGKESGRKTPDPAPSTSGPASASTSPSASAPPDPGPSAPEPPEEPALLKTGKPERAKAGDRWCEKVTVTFRNAGGRAVDSGTVTFETHVVDALGTDWGARESRRKLPVPIAPGEKKEKTWTVCVDAWRVPLGMHVETRDVRTDGWR